ncbi:hypothetical protein E2320_007935 [Naja naja]|nr:hypothetical protein E2320_007935 [Naja naja]
MILCTPKKQTNSQNGEHPEHVKERVSLFSPRSLPLPSLPASYVKATRSAHSQVRCGAGSFASGRRSGAHLCAGEEAPFTAASSTLPRALRLHSCSLPCLVSLHQGPMWLPIPAPGTGPQPSPEIQRENEAGFRNLQDQKSLHLVPSQPWMTLKKLSTNPLRDSAGNHIFCSVPCLKGSSAKNLNFVLLYGKKKMENSHLHACFYAVYKILHWPFR